MTYNVVITNEDKEVLLAETVETPAEIHKKVTSMLGVRASDWTLLTIVIEKTEG